ncbi:18368_t:CDS:2, partial [Gigaspora rosea]
YYQGNYLGTISYVWRISETENLNSRQDEMLKTLTPAVLRMLYFDLTGNATVSPNAICCEFKIFWDETEAYFNEQQLGTGLYILLALSICELCETVIERLKNTYNDPLSTDINIPSDEWIHLQFYNKYKIPIEEDIAVSTGVRNRCSIIAQESILAAADQDFSKLSLAPSSIFRIDPTLKIEETTQTQIHRYLELVKFIDTHCQARIYSFQ